jgi:ABC-type nitrate/sulfonate/bicarbonate transport system substrate-binding protein
VAGLKGKKVGVSSLGSGPDSLLREILKKNRLEGAREVAIMPVGSGTARFYETGSDLAPRGSIKKELTEQTILI